jgi:uncharacterized repeat protein (TIGR01451 family)
MGVLNVVGSSRVSGRTSPLLQGAVLIAIVSLIFSFFTVVAPVIANHIPPDGPEVSPSSEAFPGGNPVCPAGSVGHRFNDPMTDDFADVTLADGSVARVTLISVVGNTLTFEVENGLATKVFVKATTTQNVYDYTGASAGFPGPGIAHDDGLVSPATDSVSHVDFCLIPGAPDLEIEKSADVTSVNAGESFTYTITVDNVGTATATDVVITDDTLDESLTVDSATFSVDGGADTACTITGTDVSCDIGDLAAGSQAVVTIEVTTSAESCDEVRNTSTVSASNHDDVDSNEVVVGVVCAPLGSITVVKEIACEICETFTPGAFFNQGENNEMSAFAEASLSGDPIEVGGMVFDSVQSVQDNAAPGSLLRHYLALALNLRLAADNECDLANLVYDGSVEALQGMTVGEIAAEAEAVLNGEESDFTAEQLHDAIDEINNNHGAEDGVLVCDTDGTSTAGFEFTLFDDEDVEVDSGTTGADGTLTFSDLPLGTYTLVETGGPEGSDCSVVSASGEGVTFDEETGVITIVLTENNADVTVTVVNECEVPPPPELGSITIIKNAIPDDAQDFAFTTTGAGLSSFSLDDDADVALPSQMTFDDLAAGPYTVTEAATAGWDLTSIDCSTGGSGNTTTGTASITIVGSENVTCTFVNEEEEEVGGQLGSITIIKNAVPDAGQDFAFTTTGNGLSNFSLDDDADAALSNQRTFTGLAAGGYTVVEGATTGWTLTSITCSTGGSGNTTTGTASITLAAGQNVTCTFVNTQQSGGTLPGSPTTPARQGTLANTATDFGSTGSMPAALLALVMLTGLTAAAYAARVEVRRRR